MHENVYRLQKLPLTARETDLIPRVAILDTGIQLQHPELGCYHDNGNLAGYKDFVHAKDSAIGKCTLKLVYAF